MSHLAGDAVFLSTLNTWLADLVVERSDANLHVLVKLLEVLALLKAASWAGLTASGLCVTVKKAAGHRNREVVNKSTALLKVGLVYLLARQSLSPKKSDVCFAAGILCTPAVKLWPHAVTWSNCLDMGMCGTWIACRWQVQYAQWPRT